MAYMCVEATVLDLILGIKISLLSWIVTLSLKKMFWNLRHAIGQKCIRSTLIRVELRFVLS